MADELMKLNDVPPVKDVDGVLNLESGSTLVKQLIWFVKPVVMIL